MPFLSGYRGGPGSVVPYRNRSPVLCGKARVPASAAFARRRSQRRSIRAVRVPTVRGCAERGAALAVGLAPRAPDRERQPEPQETDAHKTCNHYDRRQSDLLPQVEGRNEEREPQDQGREKHA